MSGSSFDIYFPLQKIVVRALLNQLANPSLESLAVLYVPWKTNMHHFVKQNYPNAPSPFCQGFVYVDGRRNATFVKLSVTCIQKSHSL
jgi:hypothetical protein